MTIDAFKNIKETKQDPIDNAFSITPNDSTELDVATRAIYVGSTGDLTVELLKDSTAVTFVNVLSGSILPLRAKKVLSTGTTASNIVGLA